MLEIADAIRTIADRGDVAIIFPIHPNPNVHVAFKKKLADHPAIALIEPQDYPHFIHLLNLAYLVLTDFGGVQEEAPSLGKPVLVLRNVTERPEGVDAGTARLVGTDGTLLSSTLPIYLITPSRTRLCQKLITLTVMATPLNAL